MTSEDPTQPAIDIERTRWAREVYIKHRHEQRMMYSKAAVDYGLSVCRWLVVLNAGALVALLALFSKQTTDQTAVLLLASKLTWPAICFVVGVILGVLTSACGYWNFSAIFESSDSPDYDFRWAMGLENWTMPEKERNATNRIVNVTAIAAQVLGIASAILFVAGCIWTVTTLSSI